MDLDALGIFLKVAEVGSLTRAGEHLGLPKAHISRKLQALEKQLDTRLFHRSTRVVRLTPDGETLLPRAKVMLRNADEIADLFRRDRRLRGLVRVDLPVSLARKHILPALPELLERHPELKLFISTTDRIVDVLAEGFDCVVRVGAPTDTELTQRKLGEVSLVNCVSRGYAEKHGVPEGLEDLDRHQVVHYASRIGSDTPVFEYEQGGELFTRPAASVLTVNTTDGYQAACLAGLGIIQVPLIGVAHHLASGEMIEVLRGFRCEPMPVSILHTHGRRAPARILAVMDWLAATLAGHLR